MDTAHMATIGSYASDAGNSVSGEEQKDVENRNDEEFSGKKNRFIWTVELHQRFVQAVNQIGPDKDGPTKILELLNEPSLTRDDVSRHLKKYHLYVRVMQKFNDSEALAAGMKHLQMQ